MHNMVFDIKIGNYRLGLLDSVEIVKSVSNLSDTAVIKIPATQLNKTLNIESKINEGDRVVVKIGYDTPVDEFVGYVESIATDNQLIEVRCEDELYRTRVSLRNREIKDVSVTALLKEIGPEMGDFTIACNYDFIYDKFTIYNATGFDVLKKLQEDTSADIYLIGKTIHVHPPYQFVGKTVIYDFARNIEQSELKYINADKRKVLIEVEGTGKDGRSIKVKKGTPGGDKLTKKIATSNIKTLEREAESIYSLRCYTGYKGSITGWLQPVCVPTDKVVIRDRDYPYKEGAYYAVRVTTSFASSGGKRKIELGKKL